MIVGKTSLGALQLAINCIVSKAMGKSPIELLMGKRGCVPPELLPLIDYENVSARNTGKDS